MAKLANVCDDLLPRRRLKNSAQGFNPISANLFPIPPRRRRRPRGRLGIEATVCIEAIDQAGQHCYDTGKYLLGRPMRGIIQKRCNPGRRIRVQGNRRLVFRGQKGDPSRE
jgi:hypothetical protein